MARSDGRDIDTSRVMLSAFPLQISECCEREVHGRAMGKSLEKDWKCISQGALIVEDMSSPNSEDLNPRKSIVFHDPPL